jgi:DNA-binding GntR family transcriptional regulator
MSRQVVVDEIASRIRRMVESGELRPGGQVDIQGLCARFGFSRAAFREALNLVAAELHVRPFQDSGLADRSIRRVNSNEIVLIVGALEGLAGQLACAHMTHEDLSGIEALHERLADHFHHGEEEAYMQIADAICNAVFLVAANDTLSKMHRMFLKHLRWSRVAKRAPPEWDEAAKEQELMLRALRARNGALWTLLATRHNRHRVALLREMSSQLPEFRGTHAG